MKIEKVNDHQIRCTLTREDLAKRQIKISELAYGTEKARELFQEMMRQASFQFGFEADDVPLMIEAIPINSECIVLVITKTEDPEELDTRFSQFGPSIQEDNEEDENEDAGDSDDVMNLFRRLQQGDIANFLGGAYWTQHRRQNCLAQNRRLIGADGAVRYANSGAVRLAPEPVPRRFRRYRR